MTIERLDEHDAAGFRISKPTVLKRAIQAEAEKNYSLAQIFVLIAHSIPMPCPLSRGRSPFLGFSLPS